MRNEPFAGHVTFTQEAVILGRESHAAHHWNAAAAELEVYLHSLELLVVNRDEVVDILLRYIGPEACDSLPPLLGTLSALGRDLQGDFVPCLPRVLAQFTELASAVPSDADALQALFTCIAALLKHMHTHLHGRIPWVLGASRGLRAHPVRHIRCFSAQVITQLLSTLEVDRAGTDVPGLARSQCNGASGVDLF